MEGHVQTTNREGDPWKSTQLFYVIVLASLALGEKNSYQSFTCFHSNVSKLMKSNKIRNYIIGIAEPYYSFFVFFCCEERTAMHRKTT